jgi:hypothetical protein
MKLFTKDEDFLAFERVLADAHGRSTGAHLTATLLNSLGFPRRIGVAAHGALRVTISKEPPWGRDFGFKSGGSVADKADLIISRCARK